MPIQRESTLSAGDAGQSSGAGAVREAVGPRDDDVVTVIAGKDKRAVQCKKSKMADISEVFGAMFCGGWQESLVDAIVAPDVDPDALSYLSRYANEKGSLPMQLTADNVWDILKAADKYQVLPIIYHCFRFLLWAHPLSSSPLHVCSVLELAHRLQQPRYRQAGLEMAAGMARAVLSSIHCLKELCRECLLELLKAESVGGYEDQTQLEELHEVLVHKAVVRWARLAWTAAATTTTTISTDSIGCGISENLEVGHDYSPAEQDPISRTKRSDVQLIPQVPDLESRPSVYLQTEGSLSPTKRQPSSEELRQLAGDLLHHVRYLAMPPWKLTKLLQQQWLGAGLQRLQPAMVNGINSVTQSSGSASSPDKAIKTSSKLFSRSAIKQPCTALPDRWFDLTAREKLDAQGKPSADSGVDADGVQVAARGTSEKVARLESRPRRVLQRVISDVLLASPATPGKKNTPGTENTAGNVSSPASSAPHSDDDDSATEDDPSKYKTIVVLDRGSEVTPCLLTRREIHNLLRGDASLFPPSVGRSRSLGRAGLCRATDSGAEAGTGAGPWGRVGRGSCGRCGCCCSSCCPLPIVKFLLEILLYLAVCLLVVFLLAFLI